MDNFKRLFFNGVINKKKVSEKIHLLTKSASRKSKINDYLTELINYSKSQVELWNDWSKMLLQDNFNDDKLDHLKTAANPQETAANFQDSLDYLTTLLSVDLDLVSSVTNSSSKHDGSENGIERLASILESKLKSNESDKSRTNLGTYKIKINEKKKYTKKEARDILGLRSIRRVEQLMEELQLEYEKEKRGREKLISGINLKKIKKSRE